jgi:hypothetical protein
VKACVANAPTPARTHGTALPTQATRVVTATPTSPVAESTAAMENVANRNVSPHPTGSWAEVPAGISNATANQSRRITASWYVG